MSDAEPEGVGQGEGGAVESGTARAKRVLIEPLSGLARPRGVSAAVHAEALAKLARKLSYMDEAGLAGLVELVLAFAGKVSLQKGTALPACPDVGVILSWAVALQAPPVGQSDYAASVMRSAMGLRARDGGYGVELLRMARRHGPPPGAYSLTRLRDEAGENARRRASMRATVEAVARLAPEHDRWLADWHADALLVEQLIAEGDERREARAGERGAA
jgi:hypothetical protein